MRLIEVLVTCGVIMTLFFYMLSGSGCSDSENSEEDRYIAELKWAETTNDSIVKLYLHSRFGKSEFDRLAATFKNRGYILTHVSEDWAIFEKN